MYTYQDSNWVKIGTSNPDLADYYTKELANSTFATKTEINNTNSNVSQLKKDLAELNIIPIMNRVVKIDTEHYWGNDGTLNENSGYDAVTIEVEGGKSYSINKNFSGGQNFNVFTDGAGNVLGKYTSDNVTEIGNGWYFTAIKGAKYLKATSGVRTYWNDFVVIEGVHDISKVTIQDYPIGEVKKEHINVPFELMDGTVVDDELKKT